MRGRDVHSTCIGQILRDFDLGQKTRDQAQPLIGTLKRESKKARLLCGSSKVQCTGVADLTLCGVKPGLGGTLDPSRG